MGPTVAALPKQGGNPAAYQNDDIGCRNQAGLAPNGQPAAQAGVIISQPVYDASYAHCMAAKGYPIQGPYYAGYAGYPVYPYPYAYPYPYYAGPDVVIGFGGGWGWGGGWRGGGWGGGWHGGGWGGGWHGGGWGGGGFHR